MGMGASEIYRGISFAWRECNCATIERSSLSAAFLSRRCCDFAGNFPGALRAIDGCLIVVFNSVVVIRLAYRTERFVVEAG